MAATNPSNLTQAPGNFSATDRQIKSLTRMARRLIKNDARREAFEDLRANPKLAHCTRKNLRAMAKRKVDGMLREQRLLEKNSAADERDGTESAE